MNEHVERAERRNLLEDALRADVPADERRLGAERAEILGRSLRGAVAAEVADRDALGAVACETECDRAADATRTARDEDVHARSWEGACRRARTRESRPSRSDPATRAGLRLPSTTHSRGRRGAASAPRRSGEPRGRQAGRRRAPARARGSGRRSAASQARRGRRRRRGSARGPSGESLALGSSRAQDKCRRRDAPRHGPAVGAQLDRHALRAHARLPAARLRDDPVRLRDPALLGLHLRPGRQLPDRAPRPAPRAARRALHLRQPALLRLLDRQDLGGDGHAVPRNDADLHRRARERDRARADGARLLVRRPRLADRRRASWPPAPAGSRGTWSATASR